MSRTSDQETRTDLPRRMLRAMACELVSSRGRHDAQIFLGRRPVAWALEHAPRRIRRRMACELLALSPHYFFRTPENRGFTRREFLRSEIERNARSRQQIMRELLLAHLRPTHEVLDYGCGPGFLAHASAPHVKRLFACDISAGALACARALNAAPNVEFIELTPRFTIPLPDESVDLVFSFAVVQHVTDEALRGILAEWRRVLRPGGRAICHAMIDDPNATSEDDWRRDRSAAGRLQRRFRLHCFQRTAVQMAALIAEADFVGVEIAPVREKGGDFADDVAEQHLCTFRKP